MSKEKRKKEKKEEEANLPEGVLYVSHFRSDLKFGFVLYGTAQNKETKMWWNLWCVCRAGVKKLFDLWVKVGDKIWPKDQKKQQVNGVF